MTLLKSGLQKVTAFAPATSANVAVGFDILGFALKNIGDKVTLIKRNDSKIVVEKIIGNDSIPITTNKNTAAIALEKLCEDLNLSHGFSIFLQKGIPLSSGLGGSAASAVAALVACNEFLEKKLTLQELVKYALFSEKITSGGNHGDNIIPCLFGGFTLIKSLDPFEIIQLPVPKVTCIIIHPHVLVETKNARKILKSEISLKDVIEQSAHLASFISSLYTEDFLQLRNSLKDIIIEPQRAHFIPCYYEIKKYILDAGALGFFISGSGSSLMVFAQHEFEAQKMAESASKILSNQGISCDLWISKISQEAACIL